MAKEYKKSEANLIRIFQEVEESKLFLDFNLTSLYRYAVKELGLSENVACNFIAVARKASQVPLLQAAIDDGSVSVSNARKVTSVVTEENQEEWVDKLRNLSQKKLEQEVAKVNPKEATPESAKYVSEKRLQLKMGISEEMHAEFRKVQDLESKRKSKSVSLEETLDALIRIYLEVKDPEKRANRILPVLRQVNPVVNSSKTIPAVRKYQVTVRDQVNALMSLTANVVKIVDGRRSITFNLGHTAEIIDSRI